MAGFFVTFEGGEGSGKSSLIQKLTRELENRDFTVVCTHEPGKTLLGEEIRKYLLAKDNSIPICPRAELLLFLAARAQNLHEIIVPALNSDAIILCDRFHDSSIAYQGVARGQNVDEVESLCYQTCGETIPNLTFFLDIDPADGLKRSSGAGDRIEKETITFHQQVREGMLALAQHHKDRFYTIDAQQSQDEVFSEALEELVKRLQS